MTPREHQERGHTLLELTVAATLVGVVGIVFGLAGRYTSGETMRLRQRARASGELHAVVEHFRQDLARSIGIKYDGAGRLYILPERPITSLESSKAWPDSAMVEYALDGERLVRTQHPDDVSTVVALGIKAFELNQGDSYELRIHIAAGEGTLRREVTLVWEQP